MSKTLLPAELSDALARQPGRPLRVTDPVTNVEYLIVPAQLADRLLAAFDDSPWTAEEQLLLAARAGSAIGWDDMGEYDNYPDAPK
jgi:hypothetical protein